MFRYYISIFVIATSAGARLVVATNRMRNMHLALAILVTFIRNAVGYSQTPSIIRADNVIYLATAHIVTSRIDGQTFGIGSAIFAQIYVGHTFTGCLVQVCVQRALTQARPTNRIVANAIVGEATVLANSFTESIRKTKCNWFFCCCSFAECRTYLHFCSIHSRVRRSVIPSDIGTCGSDTELRCSACTCIDRQRRSRR